VIERVTTSDNVVYVHWSPLGVSARTLLAAYPQDIWALSGANKLREDLEMADGTQSIAPMDHTQALSIQAGDSTNDTKL